MDRIWSILIILLYLLIPELYGSDTLKILPMGNSLTFDARNIDSRQDGDKIGYRYELYNLLNEKSYLFDFIGSQRSGFNYFSDSENAGFKGITTKNLADLISTGTSDFTGRITAGPYLETYSPDIILLEIGTNDVVAQNYSVSEINRLLNSIDLFEQKTGRTVLVIIGTIISLQNYPCGTHPGVNLFNDNLKNMVSSRISNGDKLLITDLECEAGINYYNDMWDELHPNLNGYDKMAQKLFNTIDDINSWPTVFDIPDQQILKGSEFSVINLNNYVSDLDDHDSTLIWSVENVPQNLTVSINSDNVATIKTKNSLWTGSETITFKVTDPGKYVPGLHGTDKDQVVFKILDANIPPLIVSQAKEISIKEDTSYQIRKSDLVINDPDDPIRNLRLRILDGQNYEHMDSSVMPLNNYYGKLTVNIKLTDGKAESSNFEFDIQVLPVNDPPVITSIPNDTLIKPDQEFNYAVIAKDEDASDILQYSVVEKPRWLNFIAHENKLTGIADTSDKGIFLVHIQVSDGHDSVEQRFHVVVETTTPSGDSELDSKVKLYPSPVLTFLNVETREHTLKYLYIYDFSGKMILSAQPDISTKKMQVNITSFPAGTYIIKIITDAGIINRKLIKN